ncbi:beta-ketoacyl synthase N-terminal-like domain-containing protein [Lacrimispora brassicae]
MKTIKKYIFKQVAEQKLTKEAAKIMLQEMQINHENTGNDIAIIGMSARISAAETVEQYWDNILQGVNTIRDFPSRRWDDCHSILTANNQEEFCKGGYLNEIDKFDPYFFNLSLQEAKYMNPLQRLFLETSYQAIEDAGYGGKRIYGTNTGVYVGVETTSIINYNQLFSQPDPLMFTGSMNGILASRVAFQFNLSGPSLVVDTACSSSLTAVILACQALNDNQCEMAIAGGLCLTLRPAAKGNVLNMVESEDGQVKAFDKDADGTSWGEAVGAILLKSLDQALQDGDVIHAVIKGGAINNDGTSNGITAPNAKAQEEVILNAWKNADIDPATIGYIETHGTGTILGDPIEIKGITNAFKKVTSLKQFCGIGSVKSNIGHTVGAAGMASLLKVVLMLKHKLIPQTLNFNQPNQFIDFIASPVYVNDKLLPWPKGMEARRGGG